MGISASLNIWPRDRIEVYCEHQRNEGEPEGYPVLRVNGLPIFATHAAIEAIHAATGAYLRERPARCGCPPVAAEAVTGWNGKEGLS